MESLDGREVRKVGLLSTTAAIGALDLESGGQKSLQPRTILVGDEDEEAIDKLSGSARWIGKPRRRPSHVGSRDTRWQRQR